MTKNKNLPRVTQPNFVTPSACNNKTIILVIPAYNEEKTIGEVISNVKNYADFVVVVDDGSKDRTSEIAEKEGAIVYRHCINLGLGASLITGFKIALKLKGDIIVTFDADGQHCPFDIEKVIENIKEIGPTFPISGLGEYLIMATFKNKNRINKIKRKIKKNKIQKINKIFNYCC